MGSPEDSNERVPYSLEPGIRLLLIDLGISPANVLRRAALPRDTFSRPQPKLPEEDYFALWSAIDAEADDETLPARIGNAISVEYFSPPLFAAVSSANLEAAARRIATFKALVGPLRLEVTRGDDSLSLRFEWHSEARPPTLLALTELAFWVALARIGTRTQVDPQSVTSPTVGSPRLADYFGSPVQKGSRHELVFSPEVADMPFVTSNEKMWELFEPELQRQLDDLEPGVGMEEKVKVALVELLPGGSTSMSDVARSLAVSSRTLQRRLAEEDTTFQDVLNQTREKLARSYLEQPDLPASQISFLLGYENQSSFYRAFHQWTGMTPEAARATSAAL